MKTFKKTDFPVDRVRWFLEPGPIVLVSSSWKGRSNIMTMGWHMVMEFEPSLIGCYIWTENPSFDMVRHSKAVRRQRSDRRPGADRRRHRQHLGTRHRQVRAFRSDGAARRRRWTRR